MYKKNKSYVWLREDVRAELLKKYYITDDNRIFSRISGKEMNQFSAGLSLNIEIDGKRKFFRVPRVEFYQFLRDNKAS